MEKVQKRRLYQSVIHHAQIPVVLTDVKCEVYTVVCKRCPLNSAEFNYLLTYLLNSLTPYSTVLLGKLTGLQLVKKFHAFYGTRMFIAVFTSARYLSVSLASSIQSVLPHPTS
jgi:hypothetical protein